MRLCRYSKSDKIVEIAEMLIAKGIDVNYTDDYKWNALMWLCRCSENAKIVETAQLLVKNGTDLNHRNKEGATAADCLKLNNNNKYLTSDARAILRPILTNPQSAISRCVQM